MQIGNINLMLLQALKDSTKYGLEIIKYISDATNGEVEIKQPSLYSGLTRLEKRNLITSHWEDSEIGGRRHYYTITDLGVKQLEEHKAELEEMFSSYATGNAANTTENDSESHRNVMEEQEKTDILPQMELDDFIETNTKIENADPFNTNNDEQIILVNNDILEQKIPIDPENLSLNINGTKNKDNIIESIDISNLINTNDSLTENKSINLNQSNDTIDFDNLFDNSTVHTFTLPKSNTNKMAISDIKIENTEPEQKKYVQPSFSAFVPKSFDKANKSFSQKMRDYVEPKNTYEEYKIQPNNKPIENTITQSHPTTLKLETTETQPVQEQHTKNKTIHINNNILNETQVEYVSKRQNDDINYKDILGELDADQTPKKEVESIPLRKPVEIVEKQPTVQKSEYTRKLASILTSAKADTPTASSSNKIERIDNIQRLEELNRKYEGTVELKITKDIVDEPQNIATIDASTTGYSHITKDDIVVKPYIKTNMQTQSKIYMRINKFNIIRSFILLILMGLELGLTYVLGYNANIIDVHSSTTSTIYIISISAILLYFVMSFTICASNRYKKVLIQKIQWYSDLFYRLLLTIILIAFIISLNLFMGMADFFDCNYFIKWFIPSIMVFNISLSSLVGFIMKWLKVCRA